MNKPTNLYFPELDGLRFIAFLLVLVHHSLFAISIPAWVTLNSYGWMGVDLFFCLSSFLFAKILFVEYQEKGDIHIGFFYLRRAFRIWPLYFFFLIAMLIYALSKTGWSDQLGLRALGMLTFTDNIFTAFLGYNVILPFSTHLWTISYEEQFYLIIPWALRALYPMKKFKVGIILIATMLVGTLIRALFVYQQVPHPAVWVLPITHFEAIFGGLFLGLGVFDHYLKKIPAWLALLAGLFSLWLVTTLPNVDHAGQWLIMLTYPLVGLGMTLILFAILQNKLGPLQRIFNNKPMRYFGKISYGLYVYHFICQPVSYQLTDLWVDPSRQLAHPLASLITILVVTLLVSTLSYELLEKPFLKLKGRFSFISSRPI